ncbi:MAG: aldehyde dehydrogenase family protein [Actinobacteria bacterium]|nr:aldehyde dehydrogenase family protein [Actinomycetota bacterium]
MSNIDVKRTAKLFIGGAFPRSESGRTYEAKDKNKNFVANVALASRKDGRDAVVAARAAFAKWSEATAYNRAQVLYRVSEIMQGRREQFVEELSLWTKTKKQAENEVDEAINRMVWFAGWADKIAMVTGSNNPVAGPFFDFSIPEPTGVVAAIAPEDSALLGLVETIASIVVSGNTVIVIASESQPLPAVSLAEVIATSDVPGGVINILTGSYKEIAPWLASHQDVNALDLTGVDKKQIALELEKEAATNLKRVLRSNTKLDGLARIKVFLETKTVWHPRGF